MTSSSRLLHDTAGFLVGDPLDLRKAVSLLESIRADVRAMRHAVAGTGSAAPKVRTGVDQVPVVPVRASTKETSALINQQIAAMAKAAQPAAIPKRRDGHGRFVKGSSPDGGTSRSMPGSGNSLLESNGIAQRIASAVREGISNSEDADPTVKAFKEVAEPLKRGYTTLLGGREEKKKDGWLRRIWCELKGGRVEQTAYEKAMAKSLKAIEEKPGSQAEPGGGFMPAVANFAMRLGAVVSTLIGISSTAMLALAPLLAMLKVKNWVEDQTHDKERVEGIKENIADPLKEGLKNVGIDKDAEIEAIRTKNQREQNGADEYERMDRARAAVASSGKYSGQFTGLKPGTPEYEAKLKELSATPAFNQDVQGVYQGLDAQDSEAKKGRVAKAWEGVKSFSNGIKNRAFLSGANYSQGNISGLDDAHTRSLVASTAMTESAGGKLDITNKQGYMGRYQAGAGWLADAGLIRGGSDSVKSAMKADGYKSERKWAEAGGMSKFLSNQANWVDGMSRDKYLGSAEIQDAAFKKNSDKSYADLMKRGALAPGDSQEKIAGLLKARHLAGLGGAVAVANGGAGPSDANGTSARKYFDDLATDSAGFTNAYSTTPIPQVATVSLPSLPSLPPMPSAPQIPDAPDLQIPLSSGDSGRNITVTPPPAEPGQDLSNRRLAHIVTGGLSGGFA